MKQPGRYIALAAGLWVSLWLNVAAASADSKLTLRRLVPTESTTNSLRSVESTVNWSPEKTAVVICDMWDQHWCRGATARVAEMAPRMNEVVGELRRRGVLVIHCPSDTMKFYEGAPGRKLAQS